MRACHAGCPFGDVTVLKPLRGRVPLPASGVPGRAGHLVFPTVTSARRNALRITRWHGTGDVPRPPPRSLAPDIRVTRCPEHRHDQHPRPTTATTAVRMIPVVVPRSSSCDVRIAGDGDTLRTSWRLALPRRQHPCLKLPHNLADHCVMTTVAQRRLPELVSVPLVRR
jgi:hypothetical protein